MPSVAIAGAGITGLTAAYHLREMFDVHIFESRTSPGGKIRSEQVEGFLIEYGPNTIRGGGKILEDIVRELDLADRRIYPGDSAKKRFIVRNGRPVAVPLNPFSFATSSLFSLSGKLRLLKEPFHPSRESISREDTVREFAVRRFGKEFADYAVDPFMAGVYAGDPSRLSAAHVFERLYRWEDKHGSVVRGAIADRLNRSNASGSADKRIFTFPDGLETLSNALADRLGERLNLGTSVKAAAPRHGKWHVTVEDQEGRREETFDALVLTVPLHRLDAIRLEVAVDLEPLLQVPYPPLSILALGFRREQVTHPLDGFGVLVPEKEPFQILGALFSSSLAPGRAPDDHVLLTSFVGGMRAPEQARLGAADLIELVRHDLENLLGIRGKPAFYHHVTIEKSIPQYITGYQTILDTIDQLEKQHPGLHLAGNFRGGISVGDAMASGARAARRILER